MLYLAINTRRGTNKHPPLILLLSDLCVSSSSTMVQNTFLTLLLLLLLLGFSNLPYSSAIPTTRSLTSNMEDSSSAQKQTLMAQSEMQLGDVGEELFGINGGEEEFIEGRMDMENNDYPGTGANNHHDPKTPGRA